MNPNELENSPEIIIPEWLTPDLCLEILKEIYEESLKVCKTLIFALVDQNIRICLKSSEFQKISKEMEVLSQSAKFKIYEKYSLTQAPGLILSLALQGHCSSIPHYTQKINDLETDFKGKTELILSLINL
jgi:hypothetical protein